MHEALRPFHQATAAWFEQALGEPTLTKEAHVVREGLVTRV